ncbi:Tetratricopeptide repeat protein 28 [Eumeta japonica]|uniref:Tetratricopeptide repeat protein 28 n=1 Tax=Eumeta variegata TaxID=151549 RepID=A0A4C2A5D3_EUMVA|nr:Tetratricopeptide repeat protein 28 [Eumeta japonica]
MPARCAGGGSTVVTNADTQAAASALTSLGHVYTAIGDYPNALASHKQCVQLVKQMGAKLQEAREIETSKKLGLTPIWALYPLQEELHSSHNTMSKCCVSLKTLGDRAIEARAYAGLGHAARCAGEYTQAKKWHERQLDVALTARDKDKAGMGRAYGNIGTRTPPRMSRPSSIIKQELTISKEVHDRSSEASTHGNLAVAYQPWALTTWRYSTTGAHLGIARELKDAAGEACALLNLSNCLSSRGGSPRRCRTTSSI